MQISAFDQRLCAHTRPPSRYLRYQTAVDGSSPYWHIHFSSSNGTLGRLCRRICYWYRICNGSRGRLRLRRLCSIACGPISFAERSDLASCFPSAYLAEKLGVSKTPVREALAQLRQEGLVRIVPQRGAFVFSLSAPEVIAICEFRQTLEAAALRMSLARSPERLVAALSAAVADMDAARARNARIDYLDADTAFHEAFFAYCGNAYLSETYALHVGKIAALRTHLAVKPDHTDKSYQEHREMLKLLRDGQARCRAGRPRHAHRAHQDHLRQRG